MCLLYGSSGTGKNQILTKKNNDQKTINEITIQKFEESSEEVNSVITEDMGILDRTLSIIYFKLE